MLITCQLVGDSDIKMNGESRESESESLGYT